MPARAARFRRGDRVQRQQRSAGRRWPRATAGRCPALHPPLSQRARGRAHRARLSKTGPVGHDHDAIVVGAGHNGLICAAYLARAGLDVAAGRSPATGSAGAPRRSTRSAPASTSATATTPCSARRRWRTSSTSPRTGCATSTSTRRSCSLLHDGGPAWPCFHDVERTLEALALTYPGEVDGYRRYLARRAAGRRAPGRAGQRARRPRSRSCGRVADRRASGVGHPAPLEPAQRGRRAAAASSREDAIMAPAHRRRARRCGACRPYTPGTGLGALTLRHEARRSASAGPSAAAAPCPTPCSARSRPPAARSAPRRRGRRHPVRGRTRCAASSWTTAPAWRRPIVVSACDPHTTFVRWLRNPPASAQPLVARWQAAPCHDGYESKVDAVIAELPVLPPARSHAPGSPRLRRAARRRPSSLPRSTQMDAAHRLMAAGRVADRPMFFANVPSVLDPHAAAAVGGRHVLQPRGALTRRTPCRAVGPPAPSRTAGWRSTGSAVQPGFGDGVRRYADDDAGDATSASSTCPGATPRASPAGRWPRCAAGTRELTRYETPVGGLYLTGAATFPGAGVWGASGRNTARVILRRP